MRGLVEAEIQKHNPGCVIFQLMDNSVYFASAEDGSLVPARKGGDGVYHVDGDLVVAHKDTLCNLFRLLTPLFELAKGRKRVVVLPLPRYVTGSCCEDPEHIPNRREASYYGNIKEGLAVLNRTFRDYLFVMGMRDTIMVDPLITIRGMAMKEIWGEDPIHPKPEVYRKLASDLETILEARGQKRTAEDAFGTGRGHPDRRGSGGHSGGRSWTAPNRGGGGATFNRGRGGFRGRRPRGGRRGF